MVNEPARPKKNRKIAEEYYLTTLNYLTTLVYKVFGHNYECDEFSALESDGNAGGYTEEQNCLIVIRQCVVWGQHVVASKTSVNCRK